ncbi:hypothetical protein PYW07_006426 [Mythimna separata]|uniref:Galactose mutarotase n=1 Tax=Mythimna separata TaxID=271217 RepID=A0AAD7YWN1_MYTSE|nr:hypothetical protein PYW07_006426 [Mythimna separata]
MHWKILFFIIILVIIIATIQLLAVFELHFQIKDPVKNKKLVNTVHGFEELRFVRYMKDFNKSYNDEEYIRRFENFKASLKEIDRLNKLENNTVFGLTKFSDMSKKEFADRMLLKPGTISTCQPSERDCSGEPTGVESGLLSSIKYGEKINSSFDWRKQAGVVKPVLNQRLCQGCWAFSIVGVLESMSAIQLGDYTSRSIEELIDCSFRNNGCYNGSVILAMNFICEQKLEFVTAEEYPLTLSMDKTCKLPTTGYSGRRVKYFKHMCHVDAGRMVELVATHGPLVVAVDAYNWANYIGGVITRACSAGVANHVVQIVGYKGYNASDAETPEPYYIVRNSWGLDWGEQGYVKIAIKDNVFGDRPPSRVDVSTLISCVAEMVSLVVEDFGVYKEKPVKRFTWRTTGGSEIAVISYGAIVQSIKIPDKLGVKADLVLGFDDLDGYVNCNTPYLGATIGRCANRIGNATFEIDGKTYNVAKNQGKDHLHGGIIGFDKVVWDHTIVGSKVVFSYFSKDMEEGYPGDLVTTVTYEVTDDNKLLVDFKASTTKKTVVNLTNHSYFNLAGHDGGAEELYKHYVYINADKITKTDSSSIPTGGFSAVQNTPFDFTVQKKLGDAMAGGGNLFDDNFCIETLGKQVLTLAASVTHPPSGRLLEIHTDQPGVQFYTANSLPAPTESALIGKNGVGYRRHGAFCLETQTYPDAVHHSNFPTAILVPGELYLHRVVYKFGVINPDKVIDAPYVVPA